MKKQALFITGTGTGIGKTIASALLARVLLKAGRTVAYCKPVQTGSTFKNGQVSHSPDSDFVRRSTAGYSGITLLSSHDFEYPASPHFCSQMTGRAVDLKKIFQDVDTLSGAAENLIVEGSGGVMVPLTSTGYMMGDLAAALHLNSLVVAAAALGTLNHTLLTVEYLKSRAVPVTAILLMGSPADDPRIVANNHHTLQTLLPHADIRLLPFLGIIDTEQGHLPAGGPDRLLSADDIQGWMNG